VKENCLKSIFSWGNNGTYFIPKSWV